MKQPGGLEPLQRARTLRQLSTSAEKFLWKSLRNRRLNGFKFRRQMWLGSFIVDFVCVEAKLIVEADGAQHADAASYDTRRTAWLEGEGFRVLRFWNNEILTNNAGVCRMIVAHLPSPSHAEDGAGPFLSPNGRGVFDSSPVRGEEGARSALTEWEGEGKWANPARPGPSR